MDYFFGQISPKSSSKNQRRWTEFDQTIRLHLLQCQWKTSQLEMVLAGLNLEKRSIQENRNPCSKWTFLLPDLTKTLRSAPFHFTNDLKDDKTQETEKIHHSKSFICRYFLGKFSYFTDYFSRKEASELVLVVATAVILAVKQLLVGF